MNVLAISTDHEDILIALIGAFGLVLVAIVPVLLAIRRSSVQAKDNAAEARVSVVEAKEQLNDVAQHLPPNGVRLYQMVEATMDTVREMQSQLTKTETALLEHITWAHGLSARVRKLEEGEGA